jgi:hypothetical protein
MLRRANHEVESKKTTYYKGLAVATPTSYLKTLARDEAIAFVTSLQKVKSHLSHELHWMNEQVQQKTLQLQGIETLMTEATEMGLVSSTAPLPIELTPVAEVVLSNPEIFATPDSSQQSNGQKQSATAKTKRATKSSGASKTTTSRTKKASSSVKSTGRRGKSSNSVDLRELLAPKHQSKTFIDSVREILSSSAEPLHLNDMIADMYDDLSDQDFKRAKISLAKVLSVGTSKGRWKSVGKGFYTSN